ncbi:MAG: aldo/keto reductase [Planctomycetia bacterium]|nr:aldo/keto reductase [Planctomycetia bacterium]
MSALTKLTDVFTLNDGARIPCVGFGTWQTPEGEVVVSSVKHALSCGYRHVDTASAYENETGVGQALAQSGLERSEIFLTTKLWNADRGYETTLKAAQLSLERLGVEYVDLYLIHWPANNRIYDDPVSVNQATWKAFEKLQKDGLVRSIGLSNFLVPHLEQILAVANVPPAIDQIEFHPGYPQFDTVKFCQEHNIQVEAWSPLGCGRVLTDERLVAIAGKYGKSVAQLCIRWALQHNILPLPKSVHADRIESNTLVFDFEISAEDMARIDALPEFGFSTFSPYDLPF